MVVIREDVWQSRFGGRSDVLGETLRLGTTEHEIIGVMPQEYGFPINHRLWAPLKLNPTQFPTGSVPAIRVFGRRAPGTSLEMLNAQLNSLTGDGPNVAEGGRAPLRTAAFPYTHAMVGPPFVVWLFRLLQLAISGLLAVIAANVAVLIYARTINRHGEIVVRSALGASRTRIILQLFLEALVLALISAVVGLAGAHFLIRWMSSVIVDPADEASPFWHDFALTPATVAYVGGLAVFAAIVIGVVPALKATFGGVRGGLQQLGAGGTAPQLGRGWTALVVLQVAGAVAILPLAVNATIQWGRSALPTPNYAMEQVLAAQVVLGGEPGTLAGAVGLGAVDQQRVRYTAAKDELVRRLEAEPEVANVVTMAVAPWQDPDLPIEAAGDPALGAPDPNQTSMRPTGDNAGWTQVEPDFIDVLGLPILAGRDFEPADAARGATSIIVNQAFIDRVLNGAPAVGRSIRPTQVGGIIEDGSIIEGAWYAIVGVVPNLGSGLISEPKVYHPMVPGLGTPVSLALQIEGMDPERFINRLRQVALEVDPALSIEQVQTIDERLNGSEASDTLVVTVFTALAFSTLGLSLAGLYVLMSFTIVRRRREIGIRAALGARAHRILGVVFARVLAQLAIGVAVGLTMAALLDRSMSGDLLTGRGGWLLPAVAGAMLVVGVVAAWGPARVGLAVQPGEALRSE